MDDLIPILHKLAQGKETSGLTAYLDLAESRAMNRKVMNMKDWEIFLGDIVLR